MTKITPKRRGKFLEVLAATANVTRASKAIRVSRNALYEHRRADEQFAKAWDDAIDLGTDALEDEAVRRAHDGVLKPVYQQGRKVGTVREFSDTLLMFMLKARRPETFKDRASHELSGPGGGPIKTEGSQIVLTAELQGKSLDELNRLFTEKLKS